VIFNLISIPAPFFLAGIHGNSDQSSELFDNEETANLESYAQEILVY